ncbi:hypothetical protein CTAYLR_009313 [Chrysophaeum taylorii]|uniref:Protein kinase domain-containing protein n=1 Tax=Chrysophaeum taylorii TaxID=2483200 RepID=A0AAD7XNS5_9STRA|nr:hypothetical protein CTAYLR_009313 [Chrysophaeum taylorii]
MAALVVKDAGPEREVSIDELDILEKELGFGSYSVVHLAEHRMKKERFAVKIADGRDSSAHSSLQREWDVLRRASRLPGVVQAYGFEQRDGESYLILEYMAGGELFERILERERYTEYEARECANVLLSIVRSLHSANVLHRDIKPENLLLVAPDSEACKLADFGSALLLENDQPIKDAAGTELYIAPEALQLLYNARAPAYSGFKSDLWSCGVVVYVLLAGYPPFANEEGKVDSDVVDDILNARFSFDDDVWDDVSDAAKSLVSSLLQIDPDKRLSATAALVHPWFTTDLLDNTKILTKTLSNIQTMFKPKQKFKGGVSAIMAMNRAKRLLK